MSKLHTTVVLLFAAILAAVAAYAQTATTGVIRGVMTDDSGAVIPAAKVTLTGNGVNKTAQTQADGSYPFIGLAPGQYRVRVSFPGFANFDKTVAITGGSFSGDGDVLSANTAGTSITASYDSGTQTLTLSGSDTLAHYQQVLDAVSF